MQSRKVIALIRCWFVYAHRNVNSYEVEAEHDTWQHFLPSHMSGISTGGHNGHWSHTSLRYLHIHVSAFLHGIRVCINFLYIWFIYLVLYIACNFCSWHTCEFSVYWLRKAGKDKISEIKVVLISPAGGSAHLLQLFVLRQEAVANTKAGYRHPWNLKNCLWGAH